jgi:hypothetical protein
MQRQVFRLSVCDAFSVSSGGVNDDVVGHLADTAWVIDGATDIGDEPLVDSRSDAAWFAATVDDWLRARAVGLPPRLEDVLPDVTEHAAREFPRLARRPPTGPNADPDPTQIRARLLPTLRKAARAHEPVAGLRRRSPTFG